MRLAPRVPLWAVRVHRSLSKTIEPIILLASVLYASLYLDRPVLFCTVPYIISGLTFMLFTQVRCTGRWAHPCAV